MQSGLEHEINRMDEDSGEIADAIGQPGRDLAELNCAKRLAQPVGQAEICRRCHVGRVDLTRQEGVSETV